MLQHTNKFLEGMQYAVPPMLGLFGYKSAKHQCCHVSKKTIRTLCLINPVTPRTFGLKSSFFTKLFHPVDLKCLLLEPQSVMDHFPIKFRYIKGSVLILEPNCRSLVIEACLMCDHCVQRSIMCDAALNS